MANTFCGFNSRRITIFCVGLLFLQSLLCSLIIFITSYTVSQENGTVTKIVINTSPQVMDYIFAVLLPVVFLTMFLSAIYKKSEILFCTIITYIILWTLLTVYLVLGEEKGWFLWCKFSSIMSAGSKNEKVNSTSKLFWSMIEYMIVIVYMSTVHDYVQELRRGYSTPGEVMSCA